MAFLRCDIKSALLGKAVGMNVIIPQRNGFAKGIFSPADDTGFKTFYLLHGLSDDQSAWSRYTSVERYANMYNIAVIMPDGGRSFYTDARNGFPYWSFISEELPFIAEGMFPLSRKREDRFAAGLSMGGYGALKLGLRLPERFAAVAGLSPVVSIKRRFESPDSAAWLPELRNIFGSPEEAAASGDDLLTLAQQAKDSGATLPRILSICGTEDFMIDDNMEFNAAMHALEIPGFHSYLYPGNHNWEFWDRHIRQVMKFFFDDQLPQE